MAELARSSDEELDVMAKESYRLYQAYLRAGFSKKQAFELSRVLTDAAANQPQPLSGWLR